MYSALKRVAARSLAELPRMRASEVKKIGWRGVTLRIRDEGTVVVTNHDKPDAVIVSAEEYEAIMQIVRERELRAESELAALQQKFDERLSMLDAPDAAKRLREVARGRAKLGGKVKTGTTY